MKLRMKMGSCLAGIAMMGAAAGAAPLPEGWSLEAARDEIRPRGSYDPRGGSRKTGALILDAGDSVAQHGWFQKTFPVEGGKHYRFHALRAMERVALPRRSGPVRIVWQDAEGKPVKADVPPGRENDKTGWAPLAEPEHPRDGATDAKGWTAVSGLYRAPSKAVRAVVELHLQWASKGRAAWSDTRLEETPAPAPRTVRLATIHHKPGGKSAMTNCLEYAPLIAEAAAKRADLVVLGEAVPVVGLNKKPHETAEAIPGPTTDYFGKLAREHKLHIVVSLYERAGDAVYNAAVLIGPDGGLIGTYRKMCLPPGEAESGVTPGNDYPVFDTKFGRVGMMVCYDGFFPEVARELSNRGAEVIAWPVWGCNILLARARACENHIYVVSSTYMAPKDEWMNSAVFDHAGTPIAQAEAWDTVVVAEVDLGQPYFWRNNLGDFRAMVPRHRPDRPPLTAPGR